MLLQIVRAEKKRLQPIQGVPFGKNSREPRYRMEFHTIGSPYHPENGQESEPMTTHEGKRYLITQRPQQSGVKLSRRRRLTYMVLAAPTPTQSGPYSLDGATPSWTPSSLS